MALIPIELEFDRDCQKRLVHRFEADQPFPRTLHHFLRPFGKVHYYPGFPRPLIKMDVPGRFHATGLEGGPDFKATMRAEAPAAIPELLFKALNLAFACTGCGDCVPACPAGAIALAPAFAIDPERCTDCLDCLRVCPVEVPSLAEVVID